MNVLQLPNGSMTTIPMFVVDSSGQGTTPGFTPVFVLKCVAPQSSPNFGRYYNFSASAWSDTPTNTAMIPVAGLIGAYTFSYDHTALGGVNDETYIVKIISPITTTKDEMVTVVYGSSVEDAVAKIAAVVSPHLETIERITNDVVDITYSDEAGNVVAKFRVTHDPSGTQPEQRKEEVI
mgnify:CR=1 FL=1